jgi:hypothetical protein
MRNALEENVLNKEMLHLMKLYADSLALGENRDKLDATIEPLEQTSIPVENFRDHRPIHEMLDLSKTKRL